MENSLLKYRSLTFPSMLKCSAPSLYSGVKNLLPAQLWLPGCSWQAQVFISVCSTDIFVQPPPGNLQEGRKGHILNMRDRTPSVASLGNS